MPLPGEIEPERREDETGSQPVEAPRAHRAVAAPATEDGRRPVLDDADLLRGTAVHAQEERSRGLRHHDHPLRLLAQRGEHLALVVGRLRQDGVQRQDERSRELPGERQHVLAVGAAEDPVFVLEQDDVDVEPAQEPRRADVVAAHRLRDGGEDVVPLRARGLVDDRHCAHALDAGNRQQRRPNVEREGSDPARARRVRREDRSTHGGRAPLSAGVRRAGALPPEAWPVRSPW